MKQALIITLATVMIAMGGYVAFEPQVVDSATSSTLVSLSVTSEININCSSTAALSPNISGQTGGTATGTFSCTIETNDASGYNLSITKDGYLRTGVGGADLQFNDYTTTSVTSTFSGVSK